jgi:lysozyme
MSQRTWASVAWAFVVVAVAGCGASAGAPESTGTTSSAITMCGQTSVTGIDVYHGDNGGNPIDWAAVKAGGASFAFAKATESTDFNDPQFEANWSGMKAAGLVRGAYHFFDPAADPAAQASFFLNAVGPVSPGDLLVLDFETAGGQSDAMLSSEAVTFLSAVQTATGLTPLLYASSSFLSDYGGLGAYPLWVANYGVSCPNVPSAWTTYTFWQSSGTGSAGGISGQVDVDSFNGTLAELQALGTGGGTDAGTTGADTGTSGDGPDGSADGGSPGVDASGMPHADAGGMATDARVGTPDAPTSATDGGATGDAGHPVTAGDAGPSAFGPQPAGCGCTVGANGSTPASLAGMAMAMAVLCERRRRTNGARPRLPAR